MSASTPLYVDGDSITTTWTLRRERDVDPDPLGVGICFHVGLGAGCVILWNDMSQQGGVASLTGSVVYTVLLLMSGYIFWFYTLPRRLSDMDQRVVSDGVTYVKYSWLRGDLSSVHVPLGSSLWIGSDASVWLGIHTRGMHVAAARVTNVFTVTSDHSFLSNIAETLRFHNPDVEDALMMGDVIYVRYKNGETTSYLVVHTGYGCTYLLTQDDINRVHEAAKRRVR